MDGFRTAFLDELEKVAVKAIATKLTPQSSSVKGYSYDPKSQEMVITFKNGGTYRYKGVTPAAARAMGRNKSVGKTVHKRIKMGGYEYEKVGSVTVKRPTAGSGYVLSQYTKRGDNDADRDVERIDVHYKGKNVGFQTYHPGSDGDYVWVKSLYVAPKHRGKGVAKMLMDEVERKNKGKELRLRARPFRDKSIGADELKKIYGRRGYVQYDDENRMVKKAAKQKSYKCKFCKEQATKGVIWAEGRGIVPCCDKHLAKGKASIDDPSDIDLIRDLTKTSAVVDDKPLNIGLGAALGGSLGAPVGAMIGGGRYGADVGRSLVHSDPKAGKIRRLLWAKKHMPAGNQLAQGLRQSLRRGAMIGGGGGLAMGGLLGLQVARALKSSREARELNARRMQKTALTMLKRPPDDSALLIQMEPHDPPSTETPIDVRVFNNLTMQAKTLPEEAVASQSELVMDKMAQRRRSIAKMADAAKKQVTWQGLTMKLEHEKGDVRSGVNGATGKKWSRKMRDGYGYVPGTYGKGADGEAIDVYFNDTPVDDVATDVYKIRQKKKTGEYDEDKFMVGYASAADAKKAFLRNMPSWAFSDMTSLGMSSFKTLVGQDQKKRKAS